MNMNFTRGKMLAKVYRRERSYARISRLLGVIVLGVSFMMPLHADAAKKKKHAAPMEEVIVTALKRKAPLSEVPMAISVYNAKFIAQRPISDLSDVTQYSPSFRFETGADGNSSRNSLITVRGIGTSGFNAGVDPTVAVYVDGVYLPRPAMALGRLSDIKDVELLKGPQGTLFGANSPGGVINIQTRDPSQQFQANFTAGLGANYLHEADLFVTGGLTDDLAASGSFWTYNQDGWMHLISPTAVRPRSQSQYEFGGRVKALWTPKDNLRVTLAADYSHISETCCTPKYNYISSQALAGWQGMAAELNLVASQVFPSPSGQGFEGQGEAQNWNSYAVGIVHASYDEAGVSVRAQYNLSGGGELDGVLSHRDWNSVGYPSYESGGLSFFGGTASPETDKTTTLEVTFNSPAGQLFEYTAGVFWLGDKAFYGQNTALTMDGCMVNAVTDSYVAHSLIPDTLQARSECAGYIQSSTWAEKWNSEALYGRLTLNATDRLSFSVGGRWTHDHKSAVKRALLFSAASQQIAANFPNRNPCTGCTFGTSNNQIDGLGIVGADVPYQASIGKSKFLWSATSKYDLTDFIPAADGFHWYIRAASGYKSPGINARVVHGANFPVTFGPETSVDYETGIKSAWFGNRVRLNFDVFRTNFNGLQETVRVPPSAVNGSVGGAFIQNVGKLRQQGVELELDTMPTSWLTTTSAITYLDSKILEFGGTACPTFFAQSGVPLDPRFPASAHVCDLKGFPNTMSPKWRATNTARLTWPISGGNRIFLQGTWAFNSAMYLNIDHDITSLQKSYSIVNATAGVESGDGRWTTTFWVKNLTQTFYYRQMMDGASPLIGRDGPVASGLIGPPRTWGIRVKYNFQ